MNIKLAYGKRGLNISLPDDLNVKVVQPKYVEGLANQAKAVRDALRQPIASKPLKGLVKSSDKVGIVFNDITRPTPYHTILPILLDELCHVPHHQILLFNATGTHRPNTEAELRAMLGDEIVKRFRIIQNDAQNRHSHTLVGTTKSGNDIWIQTEYVRCDVRILTGFIEPHFFAGFSGGGKACMPGLAQLETVLNNHSARNIDHPQARWGVTYGGFPQGGVPNPVWQEVLDAASMLPRTFLLNVTLNRHQQITAVFAGHLEKAHAQGCAFVKKNAMVPVPQAYDIVISSNSGHPLDLNLYQSVKGMSAASQIVTDRGSLIIAADCWDGIPEHGEYGKLLLQAKSPKSLLKKIRSPGFLRQDMWQAQIQALICLKADVYFYSQNLTDNQIKAAWLKPCRNIEATVHELLDRYGADAWVCVLPEGPQTIPYVHTKA